MLEAFEAHGFSELLEPAKLNAFLATQRQVRDVFAEFQATELLEDAEAARRFFERRQSDLEASSAGAEALKSLESSMAQLQQQLLDVKQQRDMLENEVEELRGILSQGQEDRLYLAKLREVFEEAKRSKLLEEYDETTAGEEEEDVADVAEDPEAEEDAEDEDAEAEEDAEGEEEAEEEAEAEDTEEPGEEDADEAEKPSEDTEKESGKPGKTPKPKRDSSRVESSRVISFFFFFFPIFIWIEAIGAPSKRCGGTWPLPTPWSGCCET